MFLKKLYIGQWCTMMKILVQMKTSMIEFDENFDENMNINENFD